MLEKEREIVQRVIKNMIIGIDFEREEVGREVVEGVREGACYGEMGETGREVVEGEVEVTS